MKQRLLIGLTVLILALAGAFLLYGQVQAPAAPAGSEDAAVARGVPLPAAIEVADTAEKRMQGLSGRAAVEDDYGMLFIFDEAGRHGFWMKDMLIAIDIVWMDRDGTIVHIEHSLLPSSYPEVKTPPSSALYALETRAGYALAHGWDIGTRMDLGEYRAGE